MSLQMQVGKVVVWLHRSSISEIATQEGWQGIGNMLGSFGLFCDARKVEPPMPRIVNEHAPVAPVNSMAIGKE